MRERQSDPRGAATAETAARRRDLAEIAIRTLVTVAEAPDAPAAARGAAARTLAEIVGMVGKNADGRDPDETRDMASMTADELEREIARLEARSRAKSGKRKVSET